MPDHERAEGFDEFAERFDPSLPFELRPLTPADERPVYVQRVIYSDYAEHHPPKEITVPTPSKLAAQVWPWVVRTAVPLLVAWLLTWLPEWLGLTEDQISLGVTLAITYAGAAVVRLLEVYVDSRFGALLGWAKPAVYPTKDAPA